MPEQTPGGEDELRLHLMVLRCQAGDERAFAGLFERFGARTLAYLTGLIGGDAEDIQQEVWLAVYRGVRGLSNPRAFRTWLFQTTRHRAIDFLRRRKRELELIEEATVEHAEPGEEPPDEPEEPVLAAQLELLSPALREVLQLRYHDELSYAEMAIVLGCPIGTVRSRLHHAKRQLQELVERRR